MCKAKDISGQKFGRLTAIKPTEERRNGSVYWLCVCDCGNEVIVSGANLRQGNTKSCGCLKKELASENIRKIHAKNRKHHEEDFLKWYDGLDEDIRSLL